MSFYLLDTCTLSDYLRRNRHVVKNLHRQKSTRLAVSVITQYEIQYGLLNKPSLIPKYKSQLNELYNKVNVLAVDEMTAFCAARIKKELKQQGTPIGEPDIFIAATALVHDLTVVTNNTKHFSRIKELRLKNWN